MRRLLNGITLCAAVGCSSLSLVHAYLPMPGVPFSVSSLLVWMNAGIAVMSISAYLLSRRGRQRQARVVFVWSYWLAIMPIVWVTGGILSPALLNYPLVLTLANWWLNRWHAYAVAALSVGWLYAVLLLDGYRPSTAGHQSEWFVLGLVIVLLVSQVVFNQLSARAYARQLSSLLRKQGELRSLSAIVEQSPSRIVVCDVSGHVKFANKSFLQRLHEYRRVGIQGGCLGSHLVDCEKYSDCTAGLAQLADGLRQAGPWRGELTYRNPDGTLRIERVLTDPLSLNDEGISHYAVKFLDITREKVAEQQIHQLAYTDTLTGLPGRLALLQSLQSVLQIGTPHGLVVLGIERFRTLSRLGGLQFRDNFLRTIAKRLQEAVQPGELAARLEGDEFAVLAPLSDISDPESRTRQIVAIANRYVRALEATGQADEPDNPAISIVAGTTLLPIHRADTANDVLHRAMMAGLHCHGPGQRGIAVYSDQMREQAEQALVMERELRVAIAEGQLQLYLQPQVDGQGSVTGCEALVRWNHPVYGMISPERFITLAEESGLILELDLWVMREVHRLRCKHSELFSTLQISVNVSPLSFAELHFVDRLVEATQTDIANPAGITLEVTEGLMLQDTTLVIDRMEQLHSLGFRLSIDDFGTGYSSLAYIQRLPIDEIKIDQSFVINAPDQASNQTIVSVVFSLAQQLGLTMVAEGVETLRHVRFLNQYEAVIHQGFYFGRPEPAADWIRRWQAGELQLPAVIAEEAVPAALLVN